MRLYLLGLLFWGACVAFLVLGIFSIQRAPSSAWLLVGFDVLVFIPVVLGLTLWHWPDANQRILVDFDRQEVIFESLRRYERFLAEPCMKRLSCRFDEILAVEPSFHPPRQRMARAFLHGQAMILTIHTSSGRFMIRSRTEGFEDLHEALHAICPGRPLPLTGRQWFPTMVAVLVVLALLIALFATGVLP